MCNHHVKCPFHYIVNNTKTHPQLIHDHPHDEVPEVIPEIIQESQSPRLKSLHSHSQITKVNHNRHHLTCKPGDFQCESDGVCIVGYKVCNQYPDCSDRSDEKNCENDPNNDYDYAEINGNIIITPSSVNVKHFHFHSSIRTIHQHYTRIDKSKLEY